MNIRMLLVAPAAVAVAVLAGCGIGETDGAEGTSAVHIRMGSTGACSAPPFIREQAPRGLCDAPVDDDLSPLGGIRAHRLAD